METSIIVGGKVYRATMRLRWKFVATSRMASLQQRFVADDGTWYWYSIPSVAEEDKRDDGCEVYELR